MRPGDGLARRSASSRSVNALRKFRVVRIEPAPLIGGQYDRCAGCSGDHSTIRPRSTPSPRQLCERTISSHGTYREKLMITTSHVSLVGEDRERTRIEFAELRRNWRASHFDDWGAAVVNIGPDVTDVIIANMTVHNDYGRRHGDHDHQFAIRSMGNSTRLAVPIQT